MLKEFRPALILLMALSILTGMLYPALVTGVAKVAFANASDGSLLESDGRIVGSRLIGQHFSDPKHFWGRPSATSPMPYNAASSGGSNQGPLNPALAEAVNVRGPRLLAEAVAEIDAEIMHLSTNYVFDGERELGAFYTADDEALPINNYGETKLAGEQAVIASAPKSYIVRTSWVFGAGKENFFSNAARSLAAGKPVRAVNDLWASVTYVSDLAARVSELLSLRRYGTFQVVNGGVCSHYEFAQELARSLNVDGDALIESISDAEAKRLARRPRNTPMRCLMSEELGLAPMQPWQAVLPQFLSDLKA